MAKIGFGRGRGLRHQTSEVTPGYVLKDSSGVAVEPMDHLTALIRFMRVENNECEVEPVKYAFRDAVKSKEQLENVVDMLISRCLKEELFASTAVKLCVELNDIVIDSINLRSAFLVRLQSYHKQKEEFRQERPPKKWVGCVALLCEALSQFRMPDNSPMVPIIETSLDCVLQCLDSTATDEELECAAVQIITIGNILIAHGNKDKIKALHQAVFGVIVDGRGREDTRKKLLNVVELLSPGFI